MPLLTIILVLFFIMDPFGNLGTYLTLLDKIASERKYRYVIREMAIALFTMVLFQFLSRFIFNLLQISEITVRLSSGLILFLYAIKIIFSYPSSPRKQIPHGNEEPFIIPLAIPLVAGPGLLATILLFARLEPNALLMFIAILIAWLATFCVFLAGPFLFRVLGKNGLLAIEKLMGMVLILLAIQRFLDGVRVLVEHYQ